VSQDYQFLFHAHYLGAFPLKSFKDAEFSLHANFDETILRQMRKSILARFDDAHNRAGADAAADHANLKALEELRRLVAKARADYAAADEILQQRRFVSRRGRQNSRQNYRRVLLRARRTSTRVGKSTKTPLVRPGVNMTPPGPKAESQKRKT
jgi:hypothetical protein